MKHIHRGVAAVALFVVAGAASAVTVPGSATTPIFLGTFGAGTYQFTGTGFVDLAANGTFRLDADGIPVTTVTTPSYEYFNPSGATFDALDGNSNGPAGSTVNIGALVGTFTATPMGPSDFFLIGTSRTLTFGGGSIYGLVNDTFASNNSGAFNVTISAVPEPAQAALLLAGLGVVGMVGRRRSRTD